MKISNLKIYILRPFAILTVLNNKGDLVYLVHDLGPDSPLTRYRLEVVHMLWGFVPVKQVFAGL